jgi:VanZ family protein
MLRWRRLWTVLSVVMMTVSLWIAVKPMGADQDNWLSWLQVLLVSDKGEHAFAFLVYGLWFGALAGPAKWRQVALLLFLYGVLIELLQAILPTGRTADIMDLLADCAGLVLGLLAAWWFGRHWLLRVDGWFATRGR